MEKVTVILPVYNSEKYIGRCLDSILAQTYKEFKILIINDGSKDSSQSIINMYLEKYPDKIEAIEQGNKGVAYTRNESIKKANGKYIMFIDDDDYIDTDYIEKYVNEIEKKDYDIVIGGYRRINKERKILFEQKLIDTEWSKYIVMAPWAKIYKKDFLLKNNITFLSYGIGEDVYFNLSAYAKNPKVKIFEYIGYNWFFNTKSVSNTSQKGLNEKIDITYLLDEINKKYKENNQFLNYYYIRYYIWYLLFSGRKSESVQFINEYNKIKKWINKNNIKSNISPFSSKLKGESLKNRVIVFSFLLIEKTHLIKLFSKIYCRGGK